METQQTSRNPESFAAAYRGRRVLLTGHTGFKGVWLAEWLLGLGAEVTGLALDPATQPSLYDQLGLARRLTDLRLDVRDLPRLRHLVQELQPDFVFHLAAQALVRESYARPDETFAVNVMGTVNVLEALRSLNKPCVVICVTSDKCYENRNWVYGYREDDALGGHDPYSASKGAAEIAIASWRRSFSANGPLRIASARAGNVIGGGDWAKDRIVPDCIRALRAGEAIPVRNKTATRPWQHVLEPLSGYLWLAAVLARPELRPYDTSFFAAPFNFGPRHDSNRTVSELVAEILQHWPGRWEDQSRPDAPHEAALLQLAIDKANALLGWTPTWSFREAVESTIRWYRDNTTGTDPATARALTAAQISAYSTRARDLGIAWAQSR